MTWGLWLAAATSEDDLAVRSLLLRSFCAKLTMLQWINSSVIPPESSAICAALSENRSGTYDRT